MLTFDTVVYPKLIGQFYANLTTEPDPFRLVSRVQGIDVVLDVATMGATLNLPTNGVIWVDKSSVPDVEGYDLATANQLITGNANAGVVLPNPPDLPLHERVLQHILLFNIIPQAGHKDEMKHLHLFLMWKMAMDEPVNLPMILLHNMWQITFARSAVHLPYPRTLTKIFRFFNINLQSEQFFIDTPLDPYDFTSLKRMGWTRDLHTRQWCRTTAWHRREARIRQHAAQLRCEGKRPRPASSDTESEWEQLPSDHDQDAFMPPSSVSDIAGPSTGPSSDPSAGPSRQPSMQPSSTTDHSSAILARLDQIFSAQQQIISTQQQHIAHFERIFTTLSQMDSQQSTFSQTDLKSLEDVGTQVEYLRTDVLERLDALDSRMSRMERPRSFPRPSASSAGPVQAFLRTTELPPSPHLPPAP